MHPGLGIAVAVEDNSLMTRCVLLDQVMNRRIEIPRLLPGCRRHRGRLPRQSYLKRHCTGRSNPLNRPYGIQTCCPVNANGTGAVSVRCVLADIGQIGYAGFQLSAALRLVRIARRNKLRNHVPPAVRPEDGYDRRRRLHASETFLIADVRSGLAQKIRVLIHRLQDTG